MTGILTKSSTGLIFAETAESYPAGWTHAGVGADSLITTRAHSGAGSFLQEIPGIAWSNWPNGWANLDDDKLTQTMDVKSGANRVAKVFRALGIVGILYDDFPTTTLDTNKWDAISVTVASSIASVGLQLRTYTKTRFRPPVRVSARIKVGKSGVDVCHWRAIHVDNNSGVRLEFNLNGDGHLVIKFAKDGSTSTVDAGVYDATAYHIYSVEWLSGSAKVFLDGSNIATETTNVPADNAGYNYQTEFYRDGASTLDVDWVAIEAASGVPANMWKFSLKVGSSTLFDVDVLAETAALDNGFYDETWIAIPSGTSGSQTVELKLRNASGQVAYIRAQHLWDDLVLMLDKNLTITSLLGGQKVELLDAGGTVRKTVTCPQTGTDVYMDVSDLVKTAYGFSGYFKVYDTNGTSLLYTSATATVWGGDVYKWIPNQSKSSIAPSATLIYRTGNGLSPTTAVVTVTLTDKDTAAALSGKTIAWSAILGTVSPSSGTTDANGQASTTLTAGVSAGLGAVLASFAGDATYGSSSALQQIDLYYSTPVVDATKDFQIFLEGQEMVYSEGDYKLSADFKPQPFRIVGPAFTSSTGFWWAIEIYRKGTKEFQGRILYRKRQTGTNPLLTITGVDNIITLQKRIANRTYQDDPKLIIQDLLTRYPCGITAGNISSYGSSIKVPATYENLYDALVQIQRITGWVFRLNADNTLDFAPSFGVTRSITIATGSNETAATHEEDASQLDSGVYVVGSSPNAGLVSYFQDANAQLNYGIIEETFLEKGITEQGTLDLRAQEILSQKKAVKEIITLDWADTLAPGSYSPFDNLTVTDSDAGLSGLYQVFTITRKLLDANVASLQLTNRIATLADAMQAIRNVVKDLGVQ